jgi:protein gp37
MAENSKIEWTDHTFNPWTGCTKISPGCTNCYAEGWAKRSGLVEWGPKGIRRRTSAGNWRLPVKWDKAAAAAGRRAKVFCASLADVFERHQSIEDGWRADLWKMIGGTPHLDWLLLTKRPENIMTFLPIGAIMHPNIWLGTSITTRKEAVENIDKLRAVPAAVRFLSIEPLLEDLGTIDLTGIHWVIVGGESGPKARPMHPDWARSLREQCEDAGVPFLFKQWGEWADADHCVGGDWKIHQWPDGAMSARVGKHAAGRLLDGMTHDGYPEPSDG